MENFKAKISMVTGGNKGIGFSIVEKLCKEFDGIVYLTARDKNRGLQAVKALNKLGLHPKFHQLDINQRESIEEFAEYIRITHGGLDCIVNNAAIAYWYENNVPFEQQVQNIIHVNYFGTLNVCKILFPLLRDHARIVNISSSLGHLSKVNGKEPQSSILRNKLSSFELREEELSKIMDDYINLCTSDQLKESGWQKSAYSVSKVGVSALTRLQQIQFNTDQRTDIVVNHCHPGYVNTDLTSNKGTMTTSEGAVCPVYLALLPPNLISKDGKNLLSVGNNTQNNSTNLNVPSFIGNTSLHQTTNSATTRKPHLTTYHLKGSFLWHDLQEVDWVAGPMPAKR